MSIEYIGPMENLYPYILTKDGYIVPYIKGRKNNDGTWTLLFEPTSHSIDTNEDEIGKWVSFLSDAMAFCAGFTFGEDSHPINKFSGRAYSCMLDPEDQSVELR